jgi:hypothetical protein
MKGSEAKGRAYATKMRSKVGKALYKVAIVRRGVRGQRITPRTQPRRTGSQAAGHLTYNQTPTYLRGSGPLD